MKRHQKRLLLWLRLIIALGLMAVVIGLIAGDRDQLSHVDWTMIPLAWGLMLISTVVKAYRWSLLVQMSQMEIPFRRLLGTYLVGAFFNTMLPTSFGGDAVRAVDAAAKTGRVADATSSVVIERGIGLLAVIGGGSVFALFMDHGKVPVGFVWLVHAMFVGGLVGLLVLRLGWFTEPITLILNRLKLGQIANKVHSLQGAFSEHLGSPGILFLMLILSVVANALTMGATYLVLLAVTTSIPLAAFVPMIALSTVAELLPISIAALGVKESAYIFFLGLAGVGQTEAGLIAIIMRVLTWALALLGGVVYLIRTLRARSDQTPPAPPTDRGRRNDELAHVTPGQ
jgi:uncharacterized protein (TIRG00374 family)